MHDSVIWHRGEGPGERAFSKPQMAGGGNASPDGPAKGTPESSIRKAVQSVCEGMARSDGASDFGAALRAAALGAAGEGATQEQLTEIDARAEEVGSTAPAKRNAWVYLASLSPKADVRAAGAAHLETPTTGKERKGVPLDVATRNDSQYVAILQALSVPGQEIGHPDATGSADRSIVADAFMANTGVDAQGQRKVPRFVTADSGIFTRLAALNPATTPFYHRHKWYVPNHPQGYSSKAAAVYAAYGTSGFDVTINNRTILVIPNGN